MASAGNESAGLYAGLKSAAGKVFLLKKLQLKHES